MVKTLLKDPGLHRTLIGDGVATAVAGLLGSVPNTTYGENTSLLAITKNYDPKLLRRTAINSNSIIIHRNIWCNITISSSLCNRWYITSTLLHDSLDRC